MLLLWIPAVFLQFSTADYYEGQHYFNVDDRLKADCYVPKVVYQYLGSRDKDIKNESCFPWIDVFKTKIRKPALAQTHPGEVALHRKCRSLPLNGSQVENGQNGPWCYVSTATNGYQASPCFPECKGNGTRRKERKLKPYGRTLGQNYNPDTIDHIEKFFKKYDWGPKKYYIEKPSDNLYSVEYYRIQVQIFFGCTGVSVVIFLWITTCCCLKKMAEKTRKRRDLARQEINQIEHGSIPKVVSRPAPN